MKFEALKIKTEIVRALQEEGITDSTEIQDKAMPLIKSGKDVIGMSKTGSGKTIAFGIPILEKIEPNHGIQSLILAPTRELALQISRELHKFAKYISCSITTVYGGVAIGPQIKELTRTDIVVGTPGRILDHLQRETLDLSRVNCFVLDEADKMVEMGFIDDIKKILNETPDKRQILLFGATISEEIGYLKKRYMNNPAIAKAEAHVEEDFLEQYYYNTQQHEKFSLLVHLLNKEQTERVIIFCSTRSTVEILAKNLRAQGIRTEMIHGKLTQSKRTQVINGFNKGKSKILVASAVAARGLDIKDVTHVFNYDLAQDPQEYIHRVGRTARAGESGKAITLLSQRDYATFNQILSKYGMNVKELPKEDFPRLHFKVQSRRFGNRNFGSGRGQRQDWSNRSRSDNTDNRSTRPGNAGRASRFGWGS